MAVVQRRLSKSILVVIPKGHNDRTQRMHVYVLVGLYRRTEGHKGIYVTRTYGSPFYRNL